MLPSQMQSVSFLKKLPENLIVSPFDMLAAVLKISESGSISVGEGSRESEIELFEVTTVMLSVMEI